MKTTEQRRQETTSLVEMCATLATALMAGKKRLDPIVIGAAMLYTALELFKKVYEPGQIAAHLREQAAAIEADLSWAAGQTKPN